MATRFHSLQKQRGNSLLVHALGEKEKDGKLAPVLMLPPREEEWKPLVGALISSIETALIEDGNTGLLVSRETCNVRIPRERNQLDVTVLHKAQYQLPNYDDRTWAVATDGHRVGNVWAHLLLIREPLHSFQEMQDANTQ